MLSVDALDAPFNGVKSSDSALLFVAVSAPTAMWKHPPGVFQRSLQFDIWQGP